MIIHKDSFTEQMVQHAFQYGGYLAI